jgi:HAD superfamily hydrolase (TIGR01509 family)
MKRPRLLLFDLGNVLVRFFPDRFPQFLGLDLRDARSQYELEMRNLTNQYEAGKCSTEEYFASLRSFMENRFEIRELEQAFLSVLTDSIPGMEELVRNASARVPSALVSNTNEYHFASVLPKVPALKYLPKRYLSYQLGVIKPLPEFYQHVIRNEKVAPHEMLFIDDVEQNVKSAEQAGMVGYQFHDAKELEKELVKLGVL